MRVVWDDALIVAVGAFVGIGIAVAFASGLILAQGDSVTRALGL